MFVPSSVFHVCCSSPLFLSFSHGLVLVGLLLLLGVEIRPLRRVCRPFVGRDLLASGVFCSTDGKAKVPEVSVNTERADGERSWAKVMQEHRAPPA